MFIEGGFIDQQGHFHYSDRLYSRYHDLIEYIISDGKIGIGVYFGGNVRYDWEKANDLAEMSKKDSSLSELLSESQKQELISYLKVAYEKQVRNILEAETPKDFLYRSAETIGVIKRSKAWPLPRVQGNHIY